MLGIKTYLKKQSPRVWMWLLYGPRLWTNHFKVLPPSDRQILVTLGDKRPNRDIPRHLYTVFNFLADAGYNIYIYQKIDPKFYDWLKSYGRRMFSMKRLKFITDIPANTERMVYLFDHEDVAEALLSRKWKKLVYLSVLKPASWQVGKRALNIPFMMYPLIYSLGQDKRLEDFRKNQRKIRTYFAGNAVKYYYRNPVLKKYGQLTRRQGIAALLRSRRKLIYQPDKKEFYDLLDGPDTLRECVLMDFSKFKKAPGEWLGALSKNDFFICLSGTDYPMSHHLIESLAVGTIPIMSYPEWMEPELEHGKNALLYKNADELLHRFDEAMSMEPARIAEMKKDAIWYYEEHLSSKSFAARFEACEGPLTLGLHRRLIGGEPNEAERLRLERLNARMNSSERSVLHAA